MAAPNQSTTAFRRRQVLTIFGYWLMFLPTGSRWLWGNLTVYTSSYFYSRGGHDPQEVNTPWMVSIYMLAWAVGIFSAGPLMKHTSRALTQFLAILLFNGGIVLSYLSVRFNSISSLILTYGFVCGWGDGIIEVVGVVVVSEWAEKRQGILLSLMFSSSILGAVFSNLCVTWYINPNNLKPQLRVGSSMLFAQISVLKKTPSFFLLLAIFTIAVQGPAMFLIRFHRKEGENKSTWRDKLCCSYKSSKEISLEERCITTSPNDDPSIADRQDEQINPEAEDEGVNMTLRQVIRTSTFHALWFGCSCAEFSKVWLFNYYKIFGLRYIADDHFLTDLGTVMAVVSSLSRSLWGCCIDYLGAKNTLTACSALGTFVTAFYFFAPQVNQWMYFFFSLVFGAVINGFSILLVVVTIRLYGQTHFSANYGFTCAPYILTNLLLPLVFQGFLDNWGWFPLLFTMALFNGLSTVVQILFIPNSA